jgi:hypothetical protein
MPVGPNSVSFGGVVLAGQIAAVFTAPLALLLAPPAHGAMLLVPVGRADAVHFAIQNDAAIVGRGKLAGSIQVEGDRARLLRNPLTTGILAIAAVPMLCGTTKDPAQ